MTNAYLEEHAARRARLMPTEERASAYLFDAYARLYELGFRSGPPPEDEWVVMIQLSHGGLHKAKNHPCFLWKLDDTKWQPKAEPEVLAKLS
jgi:hypothetical protein